MTSRFVFLLGGSLRVKPRTLRLYTTIISSNPLDFGQEATRWLGCLIGRR